MKKKRIWIYMAAALSTLLLLGGCSSKSSRISAGTAAVETTTDSLPESAQTLDTRQAASLAETVSLQETKVSEERGEPEGEAETEDASTAGPVTEKAENVSVKVPSEKPAEMFTKLPENWGSDIPEKLYGLWEEKDSENPYLLDLSRTENNGAHGPGLIRIYQITSGTSDVLADGASVLPEDSIFLMDKNTVFERAEATGEWLFTAIGVESRKQDQEADMTGMENNDNKKVAMRVRSLPEAFPVVGKRLEDLGFTREDLESEMYLLIETEFLGEMTEIMGLTEMWNDNLIKELTFYSEQHFDEAKAYFTDLYGEPFRNGWDPYAMSQGGVVDWFMYWTGEGIVQLRKGQNFNWFECKYEIPEEKPEEILKQEAGLTLQEFAWSSGYYMNDLTEEDFDYLKIEKKEEDHLTWDFIYQGTECHFDLYRKKGPQLADYMSGVSYETSRVGD